MSRSVPALLSLAAVLSLASPAAAAPPARITLDGEPIQAAVLSANGTPDSPAPGDVVEVGDAWIRLDGTFPLDFRTADDGDGRSRFLAGEPPRLVAIAVGQSCAGDPLAGLSEEEVRGLRGLHLERMPPEAVAVLGRLDPGRCALSLCFTDHLTALPALPEGLECLRLRRFGPRSVDLSGLSALRSLRVLDAWHGPEMPLEVLRGLTGLCALAVDVADEEDLSPLACLTALRHLDVSGERPLPPFLAGQRPPRRELADLSFAAKLTDLRVLDVQHTWVTTLAPLADHPRIAEVRAAYSLVETLPPGRLPALRRIEAIGADLAAGEVEAFRARHPDCVVRWSLRALLLDAVRGATRLRIRSGGTCHREQEKEKTLFETSATGEIAGLLDTIDVAPGATRETYPCSCCGEPTFEFFRGDELLAMVGCHHGVALRWSGWPSDVVLTLDGIGRFCGWLQARGIRGPGEEAAGLLDNEAAHWRRYERCRSLVPPAAWDALNSSAEEGRAALEKALPDPVERALLCLCLLGCEDGSWNNIVGLDRRILEEVLPSFGGEVLGRAIRRAQDPRALNGAGRLLLGGDRHPEVPREDLEAALPAIASHALAHPRLVNRRRAMAMLARTGGSASSSALTAALRREIPLRTLPRPEEREPLEMQEFLPLDAELDLECTDRVFAARMLAKMGHGPAAAAIEEALAGAEGQEKEALAEALAALRKAKAAAAAGGPDAPPDDR